MGTGVVGNEFERELGQRLEDADFRAAFERESEVIATVDRLVNAIDDAREAKGMSKAELARRVGMRSSAVRRLLTADGVNPRLDTLATLAYEVGLRLELEAVGAPKVASRRSA